MAAPRFAVSADHGQMRGEGLDGFYSAGRRLIARCEVRIAGRELVPLRGHMIGAQQARFVAAAAAAPGNGPDPEVTVERLRHAQGRERITVHNAGARRVRLLLEVRLGTDLAVLGAVASGRAGAELAAAVHGAGLAWRTDGLRATVTSDPAPHTSLAQAGLLSWEVEVPPDGDFTLTLRAELMPLADDGAPLRSHLVTSDRALSGTQQSSQPFSDVGATGDDSRLGALLRAGLGDVTALVQRDARHPRDHYVAAGVPWRCALAPAEALRSARMLLPVSTGLAAGTLRILARSQNTRSGRDAGRLPGPVRQAGPHAPPSSTGIEATLLFPAVLAEARHWGLADEDTERLLPVADGCLRWMLEAARDEGYVPDPTPDGPYRCEVQAHAYRAAVLGAGLLDAFGRNGGARLREWALGLRDRFREYFWYDDRGGGRPLAVRTRTGGSVPHLGCTAVELLDTGLMAGGKFADGLLDRVQAQQLARLLGAPALDSGWGLRGLGTREPYFNAFGHRSGAVRVQETTTAVCGLAAAGFEKEAGSLLRGLVDAAEVFGWRLPEMYAAGRWADGGIPTPHPAACRPAAIAAASAVQLAVALVGVRPDVPAGTVALRPMSTAPLGPIGLTGLRVAGQTFSVRVSRQGTGVIEEAADTLRLVG